jgi:hypothetical protein
LQDLDYIENEMDFWFAVITDLFRFYSHVFKEGNVQYVIQQELQLERVIQHHFNRRSNKGLGEKSLNENEQTKDRIM